MVKRQDLEEMLNKIITWLIPCTHGRAPPKRRGYIFAGDPKRKTSDRQSFI